MNTAAKDTSDLRLNTVFLRLVVFWSVLIVALAAWNYWQLYASTVELARSSAYESYKKDLVYRRWATLHGGVYVPVTPDMPPNPYLSDIPERDIRTPSGKELTLINPAYMTRQVHELGEKAYQLRGHITSLKPIRPGNIPDEWERKALQNFERGQEEVASLEPLDNEIFFRFMRPLIAEEGCLHCHAAQGYIKGDIRGGISASIPWAPFRKALQSQLFIIIPGYCLIWTIGFLGMSHGRKWIRNHLSDRKRIEEDLRESERRYRKLSTIDGLTQLYNSRHFYDQLKIEMDRSNRYEQPLTILLLDIDNFKTFNDTYGHVEGDQVLRRLGQVIKKCLRETDFAFRYGGEEFTILLPMATSADGAATAERVRQEFKKEDFSPVPGQGIRMTLSIGLAQYKAQEAMKDFVHRVDELMYRAKKSGKDMVCPES